MSMYDREHPIGTSWILNNAGRGQGPPERRARSATIQQSQATQHQVALPLDLSPIQSFVDEVKPPHRNVGLDMATGAVLGAVLVRAIQNRRSQ
jgi:hypothetical protein